MHAVRSEVDEPAAEGLSRRRIVESIDEEILLAIFIFHVFTQGEKLFGDDVQTLYQAGDSCRRLGAPLAPSLRLRCHQIAPTFHIADDVNKGSAQRTMTNIKLAIKIGVGEFAG